MNSHKGGTNNTKDVIYIDVDDEITAIIDKVQGSRHKIVALVLPKRATVLQSIVNMKLLKRAAGDAKKHLVLITSEAGLMPLAGSVGIHVARSLSSRPEIPDAPLKITDRSQDTPAEDDLEDVALDASKPVGELAGGQFVAADDDDEDAIELDDEDKPADAAAPAKDGKQTKGKKFKIPDFNKFRLILLLSAVGVIVLGVVGYAAIAVWPSATITIQTDSQAVSSNTVLTLKTATGTVLDTDKAIVPAQLQEVKKTITEEAPATGQRNNGEKATGTVVLALTDCSKSEVTIPAGTGLSASGKTFITKSSVTLESVKVGPNCKNAEFPSYSTRSVAVTAQVAGASYNLGPSSFTVSGYANVSGTSSSAMSGGTDDIVKVVSQSDIDNAKQKITEQDTKPIEQELRSALIGRGLFPLAATMSVGEPETKLSADANTVADSVTVTQTIAYSMLGVKQEDLEKVVAADADKKIDTKKQSILSYGLDDAFFSIQEVGAEGATVSMQTTVVAGAELNVGSIKQQVAGKKGGDAKEIISDNPGVTNVTVEYSPFWVSSIPKKTDKITIIVREPKVAADDTTSYP